ncbi:putative RNA recognition motif domain, nucleotide-binding alpha-beta plait domain superfamily [Helianthus debilis subsp. tardiflorus]
MKEPWDLLLVLLLNTNLCRKLGIMHCLMGSPVVFTTFWLIKRDITWFCCVDAFIMQLQGMTLIFVGGLDPNVSDEHLKQVFSQYGQIVHVKIPVGKRCGFVQFADRSCAEEALRTLQGTQFGGQTVRLSWGRSPSNKQVEQSQYNGGYYGYETYGYAAPVAQDPSMYYGGYAAGYGGYTQPQQQLQSQQPQP